MSSSQSHSLQIGCISTLWDNPKAYAFPLPLYFVRYCREYLFQQGSPWYSLVLSGLKRSGSPICSLLVEEPLRLLAVELSGSAPFGSFIAASRPSAFMHESYPASRQTGSLFKSGCGGRLFGFQGFHSVQGHCSVNRGVLPLSPLWFKAVGSFSEGLSCCPKPCFLIDLG